MISSIWGGLGFAGRALAQGSTGTLSGTITDAKGTGSGISGCTVEVFTTDPARGGTPVATATTDGSGKYSVLLSAGRYWAKISCTGYRVLIKRVKVSEGKAANGTFQVKKLKSR